MKHFSKKNLINWIAITALNCNAYATQESLRAPLAPPLSSFSMSETHDGLDQGFSPWDLLAIAYSRKFEFGSLIGRFNRANRFDSIGTQFEIDAYPHIRPGTYAYLNFGHSDDSIFPRDRYGAEIYQSLPMSYDASIGFRQLNFQNSTVTLLTGSVGKYWGNYYLLLRTNITPEDNGNSVSGSGQLRRYFGDENYLAASVGAGKSLTELSPNSGAVILSSQKVAIDCYAKVTGLWYGSAGVGNERDEIRSGVIRGDWFASVGLEKRF